MISTADPYLREALWQGSLTRLPTKWAAPEWYFFAATNFTWVRGLVETPLDPPPPRPLIHRFLHRNEVILTNKLEE